MRGISLFALIGLWVVMAVFVLACSDSMASKLDGAGDDSASDSDGDSDSDSDSDGDTDSDSDPPEEEEPPNYKIPKGSGRYVFIADENHDAVVVIDSETLVIEVAETGSRPTHLVPLSEFNAAAVINLDSDETTVVRVDNVGQLSVIDLDVRPDTNALAVSADGQFVIAYYNPLFVEDSGPPGTDQEISVMRVEEGLEESFHMTVGMHPSEVVFNEDATRAFVITEEGINVIDLSDLENVGLPPLVSLFDTPDVDPETVEIAIDPDGNLALARVEGSETVVAATLDGTDDLRSYTLPGAPTDLDIAPDSTFGMLVLRSLAQVAEFDLPLPEDPLEDPFEYVELGEVVCGVATLTPDGNTALLYTTTAGEEDDRRLLTTLVRDGFDWVVDYTMLEREIKTVAAGADSGTAVAIHKEIPASSTEHPHAYSLVNLPELQVKFQQIPAEPGQLLLTPEGDFGFLLLRDDSQDIKRTEIIDLGTFIVDSLELGSPPTAAGYAVGTDKVFIAQEHPAGRITFIGVHDSSVGTVTGYALNDEISD
jgi:DNA-binding beta-propeller fold protein YncE